MDVSERNLTGRNLIKRGSLNCEASVGATVGGRRPGYFWVWRFPRSGGDGGDEDAKSMQLAD